MNLTLRKTLQCASPPTMVLTFEPESFQASLSVSPLLLCHFSPLSMYILSPSGSFRRCFLRFIPPQDILAFKEVYYALLSPPLSFFCLFVSQTVLLPFINLNTGFFLFPLMGSNDLQKPFGPLSCQTGSTVHSLIFDEPPNPLMGSQPLTWTKHPASDILPTVHFHE